MSRPTRIILAAALPALLILANGRPSSATRRVSGRLQPPVPLQITEIMYHPPVADGEFIELQNTGSENLNLSGFWFSDGIEYTFATPTVLEPGDYLVLVASEESFSALYPGVAYQGEYSGRLSNGGETVTLSFSGELPVVSLTYDDLAPWPTEADGQGYSLVIVNPAADAADPANWRASSGLGGSPGSDDVDPGIPRVLVNEALTHTDLPLMDAIELYNPTAETADIRGWLLTDDRQEPARAVIPDDSQYVLGPGGYAVVYEDVFGQAPGTLNGVELPGFFLSSAGGEGLYLFAADEQGQPTGYAHGFELGAAENGVSFGRHETSDGKTHFVAQRAVTLGTSNVGPKVGPVVVSEIFYNPPLGGIEYLALDNISAEEVRLWDDQNGGNPDNTWHIDGIGFSFPAASVIPAAGRVLVVNSDPATFRSRYAVPDSIVIFGPFGNTSGDLDAALANGGETVTLSWPDVAGDQGVPWVVMDRIRYDDRSPWPDADGNGLALVRSDPGLYGNDPASWLAVAPCFTPGGCAAAADPADSLFAADQLLHIDVEISPDDWDSLRAQERDLFGMLADPSCMMAPFASPFTYFPASISVHGAIDHTVLDRVGLRKKGFLGSLNRDKPSLKIKLDEYVDGQRLAGLRLLTLNNCIQDPRYLNQCLGYQLFARAGIPAPRCSFALVSVNQVELGIYAHVESVKGPLLTRYFEDSRGDLWEGTLSDFRPGWTETFEHKLGPSVADRSRLEALVTALQVADEQLELALEPLIDLDAFYTFWGMEVLLGHWDGYTGNTNNFFVYHDPASGRIFFLPWGIDALLIDENEFGEPAGETGVLAASLLARRLYQYQPTRQRYVQRLLQLLDSVWNEAAIIAEINRMAGLLTPYLGPDRDALFDPAIAQAIDFVSGRRQQLLEVLLPEPPLLSEPLRDGFCFAEIGELTATFRTYWGTLASANPFRSGSGTLAGTYDGEAWQAVNVGAIAGLDQGAEDGRTAVIALYGALGNGTALILYLVTYPELIGPDVTLQLDGRAIDGYLFYYDPEVSDEAQLVGLLAEGTFHLSEAGLASGSITAGTVAGQVYRPGF